MGHSTVVALSRATADNRTLFGHNSTRVVGEAQSLLRVYRERGKLPDLLKLLKAAQVIPKREPGIGNQFQPGRARGLRDGRAPLFGARPLCTARMQKQPSAF